MKLREQISIVCHVILFKPKSFHLSHWCFQGPTQLLTSTFSASRKYTRPDLPLSLSPGKYPENSFWIDLFLSPTLHCWNNLRRPEETSKQILFLSGYQPVPTAKQQEKKNATADNKFVKQASKIRAILPKWIMGQGKIY